MTLRTRRAAQSGLAGATLFSVAFAANPAESYATEMTPANGSFASLRLGPGQWNHPVHVRPSTRVAVPPDWPLDADGTITCTTCHLNLPAMDGSSTPRLRSGHLDETERLRFCATCHAATNDRSAASMHWQVIAVAHVQRPAQPYGSSRESLDADSRQCLACHDGVNATESVTGFRSIFNASFAGDRRRDHPVGMAYDRARRDRKKTPLRPAALLPPGIRLPGGRVSCVSCHNLYAKTPSLLSVPIEGSRLCLTCHAMD